MDDLDEYAVSGEEPSGYLGEDLEHNLSEFRKLLTGSQDIIIRELIADADKPIKTAVIYLENMADKNRINEYIIRPLAVNAAALACKNPDMRMMHLKTQLAAMSDINTERTFRGAVDRIFSGETVLVINGWNEALIFNTRDTVGRRAGMPETEVTVRGPRECFVETLETNISLLRRRISHPDLKVEISTAGEKTRTKIGLVYLRGVANDKVVAEIRARLRRIKTDGILGAGYIEQFIEDAPLSPFSTIAYSERLDVAAGKILEGRVAILVDGNPEALTVPALFIESFQNPDDYNTNPYYATLIRWVKFIAFGISILGPASYIALSSYHQELIPTPLFINMAAGAEGTPFPVFVEVIVIGLLFEILREAGIRLPRPLGHGITFVAALVLAQASVAMGLTGVATVVVVTITAISSLVVPNQAAVSILIRFALAVLASIFGAYGILLGLLWILAHAASLRSFGVPFLAPVAPYNPRDIKQDVIFRLPLWAMPFRPRTVGWRNPQRQEEKIPSPPQDDEV